MQSIKDLKDGAIPMAMPLDDNKTGWPKCIVFVRRDMKTYVSSYILTVQDLELGISAMVEVKDLHPQTMNDARKELYLKIARQIEVSENESK